VVPQEGSLDGSCNHGNETWGSIKNIKNFAVSANVAFLMNAIYVFKLQISEWEVIVTLLK
jgi:hypothetical protein